MEAVVDDSTSLRTQRYVRRNNLTYMSSAISCKTVTVYPNRMMQGEHDEKRKSTAQGEGCRVQSRSVETERIRRTVTSVGTGNRNEGQRLDYRLQGDAIAPVCESGEVAAFL